MPGPREAAYTPRHVFSRSRILAWSHRSRFRRARMLVRPYAGGRLLDYGCGDGLFLEMVRDLFPERVGTDVWEAQLDECRERYAGDAGVSFLSPAALGAEHDGAYPVVTCMEVLEHCPPAELEGVLRDLARLVSPGGVVLVSVPVELGLSLALKHSVRLAASLRGLGPYRDPNELYRPGEFLRMVFAGERTSIPRPVYWYGQHGHKGFNWRSLRARLAQTFVVEDVSFSPLPPLRGVLNSQVWLRCSPRPH
ncbi:MAG TPA: class I SAM-dependent methyltransferase [Longimicrobiaceae bacterium]|nr:class I SAM-dependent methyltransferase [Longimicrobiaceae bacterium]